MNYESWSKLIKKYITNYCVNTLRFMIFIAQMILLPPPKISILRTPAPGAACFLS